MSDGGNGGQWRGAGGADLGAGESTSRWVFGAFWALLFVATFFVAAPWAGFHAVLLGCVGLLVLCCPPVVALPRLWWGLAAVFVLAGAAVFLPAGCFTMPPWRQQLAALGVATGPLVVIQARQAAEAAGLLAITLGTGLWLAGHRPSPAQARRWALAFTLGVAAYAVIARLMQNSPPAAHPGGEVHFGFFPNRNHSATLLAMGAICGLGNVLQAMRDKRFTGVAVALGGTGVCLWAVAAWSVSRGGVVLVALGCLAWLPMLGTRYLGKHGFRALALIGLAAVGLFFIADSGVKSRLTSTVEKASLAIHPADTQPAEPGKPELGKPELDSARDLDFRIPTALDTLGLIRDFKWTGVGAGQYRYIFPQYRQLTAVANGADSYHPESDWLWLAAESGIPATLALAALVMLAFRKSLLDILHGRDRAVRSACLVAALLVPIHGLFDVPGHRITLALSAALLFALSLRPPPADSPPPPPRAWPFRLAALAVLVTAGWLVSPQWRGAPQPALGAASTALQQARALYREDQALQQAALAKGLPHQPAPADDRLEKALTLLQQVEPLAPLDRDLLRYQAFLALHFDDKFEVADRSFALDRALDPTWIEGPLRQAQAWAPLDPQRCAPLWSEALRRAARLDRLQPGTPHASEQTLLLIQQFAKGKPELEKFVPLPQ